MDSQNPRDRHLKEMVDRSRFWDAEDLMRNFDREMARLEQGLEHMVWDAGEHRVTTYLRPLPMTPSFKISEGENEFKLTTRLPNISKEDLRLSVDRDNVEIFACSRDLVCRPYYIGVLAKGELVPESADAVLSGEVLEVRVKKVKKKRLTIK